MRLKRQVSSILVLLGVCLIFAHQATGYVPIGEHILQLMLSRLRLPDGFYAVQTITSGSSGCSDPARSDAQEAVSWFKAPGMFRFESTTENLKKIYLSTPEGALTIVGDKIAATGESEIFLYKEPFLFGDRNELAESLSDRLGLDLSVSSLGRIEGKVAYVVGARYPDLSVPQLWVEKESLLPLRLIAKTGKGEKTTEARYLEWRKTNGVWFPMRIEVFREDKPLYTLCCDKVQKISSFESGFFDINSIRQMYKLSAEPVDEEAGNDAGVDDVEKTIDDFKKLYTR